MVFWVVALCSLVGGYRCFRRTITFVFRVEVLPEDAGNTFLQNTGNYLQDYIASQLKKTQSTFKQPIRITIFPICLLYRVQNAGRNANNSAVTSEKYEQRWNLERTPFIIKHIQQINSVKRNLYIWWYNLDIHR
jgi:hypothetical protein